LVKRRGIDYAVPGNWETNLRHPASKYRQVDQQKPFGNSEDFGAAKKCPFLEFAMLRKALFDGHLPIVIPEKNSHREKPR